MGKRHAFSKVPEVTAFFWIVKALTTAMGESTSDFLVHSLVPEIAVVLGGIAFAIALYLQFSKDRYVPWAYWLAVAMVGVFGTMAADVLHVGLGVPYIASTIFYAIVLAVVFRTWYVSEGTLSIHSITHAAPRALLLGGGPRHLRARDRRRRPHRGHLRPRLLRLDLPLRRDHRHPGDRLLPLRDELDPRLLVRLRADPADRRIGRRLARRLLRPRRPRPRHRPGQPRPGRRHRRSSSTTSRGPARTPRPTRGRTCRPWRRARARRRRRRGARGRSAPRSRPRRPRWRSA